MDFIQFITVDVVRGIDSRRPAEERCSASVRTFLIKAVHALAKGVFARHSTLDFDRVAF